MRRFDVEAFRREFPVLETQVNGYPLAYFDGAASSLKPRPVVDRISHYYLYEHSNVHRGIHHLSETATRLYENARKNIANFIGCENESNIVFTSGCTASLNILVHGIIPELVEPSDTVLVSPLEHHANIVPWQLAAQKYGFKIQSLSLDENFDLDMQSYERELNSGQAKIVCVNSVSNALGAVQDIDKITQLAHDHGALVVVDGAQEVGHFPVDVQKSDVDFYAFSSHKMYGPTGFGVLYGKKPLLSQGKPVFGGGDMIEHVSFSGTTFAEPPSRYEPGTPHIAGAVGTSAAIEFIEKYGVENLHEHENDLAESLWNRLDKMDRVRVVGRPKNRTGIFPLIIDGIHPHDLASVLDGRGVAVRAGHHCAEPFHNEIGLKGTTRVSLSPFNHEKDLDQLCRALDKALKVLG